MVGPPIHCVSIITTEFYEGHVLMRGKYVEATHAISNYAPQVTAAALKELRKLIDDASINLWYYTPRAGERDISLLRVLFRLCSSYLSQSSFYSTVGRHTESNNFVGIRPTNSSP